MARDLLIDPLMVNLAKRASLWKRYSFIFAGTLVICAVLAVAGVYAYRKVQPRRLALRAEAYLEKKDYKSAALTARRGLAIDASSVECYRALARGAEKLGVSEALTFRQRLAALQPKSPEASLDLAETAMRFGEVGIATEALAKIGANETQNVRYQGTLGNVTAALKQWDAAATAFEKALTMDPANVELQIRYALV